MLQEKRETDKLSWKKGPIIETDWDGVSKKMVWSSSSFVFNKAQNKNMRAAFKPNNENIRGGARWFSISGFVFHIFLDVIPHLPGEGC